MNIGNLRRDNPRALLEGEYIAFTKQKAFLGSLMTASAHVTTSCRLLLLYAI